MQFFTGTVLMVHSKGMRGIRERERDLGPQRGDEVFELHLDFPLQLKLR